MSGAARLSPWGRLVVGCGLLLGAVALALLIWSVASSQERRVSYSVRGGVAGVALDLGDADVEITGGGRAMAVVVSHVDRFGFDHGPSARRVIDPSGTFTLRSRCPATVLHGCSVRYRVTVPDNVPLAVTTDAGSVRVRGYRGSARVTTGDGDIDIAGFCGFSLQARADAGDIVASTACPPPQLSLRTTTGAVAARVPAGRYRIDASTSHGQPQVHGLTVDGGAPFAIQALSSSGAVSVERGP